MRRTLLTALIGFFTMMINCPMVMALEITSVEGYVIPADGLQHSLTVRGSGFSANVQVILDDSVVPFIFVTEEELSINVSYSDSGIHYLQVLAADGSEDSWEKHIISVRSGELVLNPSSGTTSGGTLVSMYSLTPAFENNAKVSFTDASGAVLPAESVVVIGSGELEVTTPTAVPGAASVIVDNPNSVDLQRTNGYEFVATSSGSGGSGTGGGETGVPVHREMEFQGLRFSYV